MLERLAQHGYLNDAEFARFWVENRERFRPRGSRALRQELRQKGVDEKTAAAALAELDPADSAFRAAESQARRLADLANSDARSFRQKLSGYLMRRGFDYEVVRAVVNRFLQELAAEDDGAPVTRDNETGVIHNLPVSRNACVTSYYHATGLCRWAT